jgi:CBS domain-containing protein
MDDRIEVYERALFSARAKRALCALVTAFAVVIGLWTVPAQAANGTVTGTVTDAEGNPLSDVLVEVFWYHDTADAPHWDSWSHEETDNDGHYSLSAPPGTVRVRFHGEGIHAGEWFDDVSSFENATDLSLASGGGATADAELAEYGQLHGHVIRQSGDPRANSVVLLDPVTGAVRGRTSIGTNGDYTFGRVAPGSYKVSFNRLSGFAFSAAQFWNASGEHLGLGAADVVTVDPGDTVIDVDATLVEGAHITGSLLDQSGAGMSCRLQAYTADGSLVTRAVTSAADGTFDLSGLTTGGYLVRVLAGRDCQNGRQYVTSTSGPLSLAGGDADPVTVSLGSTTELPGPLVYQMGLFSNVTAPTILGSPAVGSTITVDEGTWTVPNNTLTFLYEWLVDGFPVYVDWSDSLFLDEEFEGSTIAVRLHAYRDGYRSQTITTAPVGPVASGLDNLTVPTIVGSARVGGSVTATPGTWAQPGVTFRYRWQVGSTTLQNSADPALSLTESMYGARLSLTVIASKPGFADTESAPVVSPVVSKGSLVVTRMGKITGSREVGGKLKVRPSTLNVAPTRITYSWRRDGRIIAGAKGRTYKIVAKDAGTKISVQLVYSRPPAWLSITQSFKARGGPIGGREPSA